MTNLDRDECKRLLALRDKATPGPWRTGAKLFGVFDANGESVVNNREVNFPFVASAHNLADQLEAALAELDTLEEVFARNAQISIDTLHAAGREIERLRAVADAAEGICMGDDWNKGTHAKIHRPRLIRALMKLDKAEERNHE